MAIKGYVVRGSYKGARVFAVGADGFSEDAPGTSDEPQVFRSARGALSSVVEMEDDFGCTDVAIFRVHDDGREERLPSYEEALALLGADPLAALEAAERRLLEAGGWIEVEAERWQWPGAASPECRTVALTIERRRLAAKGGA